MVFTSYNCSVIFDLLEDCKGVKQLPEHHPEGDVFVHSLQVVKYAFKESYDTDLIFAALLHDIGKKEKVKGHEAIACDWLRDYVSVKTLWLIEHHMRIWYYILGDMKKFGKCQYIITHPWLSELIQLARWDKMGRVVGHSPVYSREEIIQKLNTTANNYFGKKEYQDKEGGMSMKWTKGK